MSATTLHDQIQLSRRLHVRGLRWHWRYVSKNGRVVCSGQSSGYSRRIDAVDAAVAVTGCKPMYGGTHLGDGHGRVLDVVEVVGR